MLLNEIEIKNFRGISELKLELGRCTILIGENNAGKTSILEALHICLSKSLGRKFIPFAEYDFHLTSDKHEPRSAPELRIRLRFVEEKEDEWPDAVVQGLEKAVQVGNDNKQFVHLQVSCGYDLNLKDFALDWTFLDLAGNPLTGAKSPRILQTLQQLNPAFFLAAVRDASQHFQGRSTFWGPFTRNPQIDDKTRAELEKQVEAINQAVLDAHKPFDEVKDKIARAGKLVPLAAKDLVNVEAVPARIFDMLSRTQVKLTSQSGAKLPIQQHGAGTQSLAVLFLFEAFLSTRLAEAFDKDSEPLLALEEPEAHLHPSAIRSLWPVLNSLKGQKVVATHSGELLASVPLGAIRRLAPKAGKVCAFRLGANTLTPEDERKVTYHVRAKRGNLLFARSWLLVEGESEFWFMPEAARLLELDLELEGVCCVEFAQCGLAPLIKVAADLGIEWHVLADGDQAGQAYVATAKKYLGNAKEAQRITLLPSPNLELCLWNHGYQQIYEGAVGKQQQQNVTAAKGTPAYIEQTIRMAISSTSKPYLAIAVLEAAGKQKSPGLPPGVIGALNAAVNNARL